jgi:DNA repair protein RadA/Sms
VVCGEVGLAGEIRATGQIEMRVREAERLGFTRFILPRGNLDRLTWKSRMDLQGVSTIQEVLAVIFD